MKNLEQRIARLEQQKLNPLIDFFHASACMFAQDQGKPEPERPDDIAKALEQLADYLPN
ncbi:hypothetical protein [Nitrosomonas sp. Is37]|uniref:hypothetical protein n=1 Tax=Nitrosomonas sp. Is37 TaxID=3080535 RepID=UPI00294B89CD|nr:hypothetical protein [Nitrosomonas sp. Is37]MDV6345403.1 hypothetical protein [Nitrosomonas sp. Is37]